MNIEEALGKDLERSGRDKSLPQGGKRLLWFLLIPVVLCTSALFMAQARQRESRQLRATTSSLRVQTVNVIHPQPGKASSDLVLPGMIQAFSQSPIYARVDGYIRTWYVDIGTWPRVNCLPRLMHPRWISS
jgi:hypothetical protein